MNCRRAKQLIYDYLDGVLGDSERITLERHLCDCRSCETFSAQLGNSLDLLHRAPAENPSEDFNWQVRLRLAREKNAITEAMTAQREIFKTWNLRFALSALSTFVVIIASGVLLWNSGLLPQPGTPATFTSRQPATEQASRPTDTSRIPEGTSPPYFTQPDWMRVVANSDPSLSGNGFSQGAIDEASGRIFPPDSLVPQSLISKKYRYRLRMLEDQVEHLQKNLRECQGGQ
jgi:hypothetical protein